MPLMYLWSSINKKPIVLITIWGFPKEIWFKAESIVQAESWKALIQHQIDKYDGKSNKIFKGVKNWWKFEEVEYLIILFINS